MDRSKRPETLNRNQEMEDEEETESMNQEKKDQGPSTVATDTIASTIFNAIASSTTAAPSQSSERANSQAGPSSSLEVATRREDPTKRDIPPRRGHQSPPPGAKPIVSFLAENTWSSRGWKRTLPPGKQRTPGCNSDFVLSYPSPRVVRYVPTANEVKNVYIHLQLVPLITTRPATQTHQTYMHGNEIWNQVFHPNIKQILRNQDVKYPTPTPNSAYPAEQDVIKFQFNKWEAEAAEVPYRACILGGSVSDNKAMRNLLEKKFGGGLLEEYSPTLVQVLASKLDAYGRIGMEAVSQCRILSASSLQMDRHGRATISGTFGELLLHCSATATIVKMAGWFRCQGKISTYPYHFANRLLRVYSIGCGVGEQFQGHVQVLLDSFTKLLDL
jgi:hypothetical protein